METLKTATGKEFLCDYFNPHSPAAQVNIRIVGSSLIEVVTVFGNPSETVQLWCGSEYLAHYTHLDAIISENDAIRVVLRKE